MQTVYEKLEYRRMGLDYIWAGLFGQMVGMVLLAFSYANPGSRVTLVWGEVVIVLATAVLTNGLGKYSYYYGFSRWWGILGIFSLGGLVIISIVREIYEPKGPAVGRGFAIIHAAPFRKDVWRMDIQVLLDDSLGIGEWEPMKLHIPRGASVRAVLGMLSDAVPQTHGAFGDAIFFVNGERVAKDEDMRDGDVLKISRESAVSA